MSVTASGNPHLWRRLSAVLGAVLAAIALIGLLPDIALDTWFADVMVRISDTAYWTQMPLICAAAVVMAFTRPGISRRRRGVEAGTLILAMLVVLAGNGLLNESVVKEAIGVPRPNIVELAEAGTLGPEVADGDAFYALGNKDERRSLLADRLTPQTTPELSDLVRDHWIHEAGYALPSGHTTTAVAFATMWAGFGLAWMQGWRLRVGVTVIPVWAVAVTVSRYLLGVHTAADLIAGAVAGVLWGAAALWAVRAVAERRS